MGYCRARGGGAVAESRWFGRENFDQKKAPVLAASSPHNLDFPNPIGQTVKVTKRIGYL